MPIFDLATLLPQSSSGPRLERYVLTSSNAALAVPSWAQGGKGIMLVSGTAAGGGVASMFDTEPGGGGGSGAWCRDFLLFIPSGVTSLNVQVGLPSAGNQGGDCTVTMGGNQVLRLGGGFAASSTGDASGGRPFVFPGSSIPNLGATISSGYSAGLSALFSGEAQGAGVGAGNPYGISPVRANVAASGIGFGWGASGRLSTAGSAAARAGGPGILMVEFREGL